jgi:hypothetical protein
VLLTRYCHVMFLYLIRSITLPYITFPGSKVSQNDCRMWNKSYNYAVLNSLVIVDLSLPAVHVLMDFILPRILQSDKGIFQVGSYMCSWER